MRRNQEGGDVANLKIGQIVSYRVADGDAAEIITGGIEIGDLLPAIVVRVVSEGRADLRVFCVGAVDALKSSVVPGSLPDGEADQGEFIVEP